MFAAQDSLLDEQVVALLTADLKKPALLRVPVFYLIAFCFQ